jgi:uncharacterized glyoxalase superfamily protein PhnB
MIHNRSAPPGTVVPWLTYKDVDRAIAWLCGAFGFTERLRTPPESDGSIHHAQLAVGAGAVVLTSRPGHDPWGEPAPSLLVPVDDVDAHCDRARQFGARILSPPRTCEFGERQYSVEDLAGYRWTFSQSVADVNPEDWGAVVRKP